MLEDDTQLLMKDCSQQNFVIVQVCREMESYEFLVLKDLSNTQQPAQLLIRWDYNCQGCRHPALALPASTCRSQQETFFVEEKIAS